MTKAVTVWMDMDTMRLGMAALRRIMAMAVVGALQRLQLFSRANFHGYFSCNELGGLDVFLSHEKDNHSTNNKGTFLNGHAWQCEEKCSARTISSPSTSED